MEKLDLISKKLNRFIPGALFGLLSVTFGFLGDLIAYLMYPGYDFTKRAVSSLCKGPGGLFFQIGTVFSGIFAFFFVIYLGSTFNKEEVSEKLRKSAVILGIISCVCITLFNILLLKDSKYPKLLAFFGFLVSFTLLLLMILFYLHLLPTLRFLMIILPSLEWINAIGMIFWYLIISLYMIYKKI